MRRRILWWSLVIALALSLSWGIVAAAEYDFNGATLKFQTRWWGVTPLGPRNQYDWYGPDAVLQAHIEAVEEMFNCKIEWVEPGEWFGDQSFLATRLMAGDLPFHFTHLEEERMAIQASLGTLAPLEDVLEEDFYATYPRLFQHDINNPAFAFGEHIYGFEALNFQREVVGFVWNIDLFEREGLPSLYELYQSGEWTYDKMAEIARKATRDIDGDGTIDQMGLYADHQRFYTHAVIAFGGSFERVVDGKIQFSLADPKSIQGLEFAVGLFREGVANNNYWGNRKSGNFAMGYYYVHDLPNVGADSTDRFGVVPPPKGPGQDAHLVDIWSQWMGVVPLGVENPRGVIEVAKALFGLNEPYIEDMASWEEKWWYVSPGHGQYIQDMETFENWLWMLENAKSLISPYIKMSIKMADWEWWNKFHDEVVNQGVSVSAYINEWAPVIQTQLDSALGQ
jgi:ABC-type glycerol-3-phosphate transport system substrate-binding protein